MERTVEQIMEHLLAKVGEFHEEMKAEMSTNQANMDTTLKEPTNER
jgi:gamma-glutamylcysteine synthetase